MGVGASAVGAAGRWELSQHFVLKCATRLKVFKRMKSI